MCGRSILFFSKFQRKKMSLRATRFLLWEYWLEQCKVHLFKALCFIHSITLHQRVLAH